jgi:hypothetical protein
MAIDRRVCKYCSRSAVCLPLADPERVQVIPEELLSYGYEPAVGRCDCTRRGHAVIFYIPRDLALDVLRRKGENDA